MGGRERREEVDEKKLGFNREKAAGSTQTLGGARRLMGAAQEAQKPA